MSNFESGEPLDAAQLRGGRMPNSPALEREFVEGHTAGGVRVPVDHRGLIFKTIVALRSQGREITPETIADSIARSLPKESAAWIARELSELTQ